MKEHLKGASIPIQMNILDTSLKLGISFFIETEEYEKCAHLQKILDNLFQSSLDTYSYFIYLGYKLILGIKVPMLI